MGVVTTIARTTSDNIAAISANEGVTRYLNSRNPNGLGFSNGVVEDGRGNYVLHSDYEAMARKAEAMEREIAELREALRPFAAVEPVSISTSDGHISSNAFRRARTLLNGGSDAQG